MNYNVCFNAKSSLLTEAATEIKNVAKSSKHEYNSNSMLGLVENKVDALKDEAVKLTEAYKAKYAPYVVEQKAPTEELTEAYKRARGL